MDVYRRDFVYSKELWHEVTAPVHKARRCGITKGDVFFTPSSEVRDDIGHSAVAMEDMPGCCYSYHVVRLRVQKPWDLKFRAYAFKTKAFMDQASVLCDGSGTRYVISQAKFRSMEVTVPRDTAEQTAIAAILSDMDAEITALEAKLAKARQVKQGMMQELLTGKTRLV
jgi:type I restriction enzyme S subunit